MEIIKTMLIWLLWRFELSKDNKKTKVPYSAISHKRCGTTKQYQKYWCSYDTASAIVCEEQYDGQYDGVGFVVPEGYGVIDIDHADDDFIREIHGLVNSYMEISPSGEGVHIIFSIDKNKIPQEGGKLRGYYTNNRNLGLEVYIGGLTNRYMTYTGNALTDDTINDCTAGVKEFLDRYMRRKVSDTKEEIGAASSEPVLSDDEILTKARSAKNRKKFIKLYDLGEIEAYPSQSEADQALCDMLAFWSHGDAGAIGRLFKKSALYREKSSTRDDYLEGTISKAITLYNNGSINEEQITPSYVYTENGKAKICCPELVKLFKSRFHMLNVRDSGVGCAQRYLYVNGCYLPFDDDVFKGHIRNIISEYNERLISTRVLNEVFQILCTDLDFVPRDCLNSDENIINFRNGILHLDSMELSPHNPAFLSTIQIPCVWTGKCSETPIFDKFIERFTNGNNEVKELLLEFMGAVISNVKGFRMKKALFIVGLGDSGKSVLKSLTEKIIGKGNYMPTDLKELEERFGTGYICNKRLAGTSDMSFLTLSEIKSFKKATGGDSLFGEFKREIGFDFVFNGLLWFCMNRLPRFGGDDGPWVYDRMMVVEVPNSIPPEEQDRNLLDKLYAEREGIIFKAVMALKSVINNGYQFSEPDTVKRAREKYKSENNSVIAFFDECMVEVTDGNIGEGSSSTKVYRVYAEWCRENNHGYAKTAKEFRDDLSHHLNTPFKDMVIHRNTGSYYRSYSLTEAAKNEYQRVYGPVERDDNPFIRTK